MTPFDVTYAHEFLIQEEFASAPQHQVAFAHIGVVTQARFNLQATTTSQRAYPLLDAVEKAQATLAPQPRSMQTPSYTEFVLQVLDRDSIMTSLLFIGAYIGLMQSL